MTKITDFELAALRFMPCTWHGVRWITEEERDAIRWPNGSAKRAIVPFGQPAGGRTVHGRGKLVTFRKTYWLTSDIAAMLADGGRWPWDAGVSVQGVPSVNDGVALDVIRSTWSNVDGALAWRAAPHSTIPAGSPAIGLSLADGRRVLMRRGVGFLANDVAHALQFGKFPWMVEWD